MKITGLKTIIQEAGQCSVASSACVAAYYNNNITYDIVKNIASDYFGEPVRKGTGVDAPQIGMLLNLLGFRKVTLVTSDIYIYDYSWSSFSRPALIDKLNSMARKRSHFYHELAKVTSSFLSDTNYSNHLKIDYRFGDYIREYVSTGLPIVFSFNWHMFFKMAKDNDKGEPDDIFGEPDFHAAVIHGYNKKGVNVIDSHRAFYKYKLKDFRKGRYHIPWEHLMVVMSSGDLLIPEDYSEEYACDELVQMCSRV